MGYPYHRHLVEEDVFYVQRGTGPFEIEAGDVAVDAGEMVSFGPAELQLGEISFV